MPYNLKVKLMKLLHTQLKSHFIPVKEDISDIDLDNALSKFIHCVSNAKGKYYNDELDIQSFYHSDKYVIFLYYLSRVLFEEGKIKIATHVYYLNMILHAIDIFYEVEMPDIFLLTHPVGSVLGRGKYNNYFCAYQNCTIGSDIENGYSYYPELGEGIIMYSGSKIIGKCVIGSNCIFGANSFILNTNIPDNSVVVGTYPSHKILKNKINIIKTMFK